MSRLADPPLFGPSSGHSPDTTTRDAPRDPELLTPRTAIRVMFGAVAVLVLLLVLVRLTLNYVFAPGAFVAQAVTLERLLAVVAVGFAATVVLWLALTRRWFFDRFVGPATPTTLGIMRAVACAALLQHVLYEPIESLALLPTEFRQHYMLGVMSVLERLSITDRLVQSWTLLLLFRWMTGALLVLGMVGWRTRLTLPLAAASYVVFGGLLRQYSWFWHMGLIPLTFLLALMLTPCGDGFSIDRVRRVYRGEAAAESRASARYGWCRWFGWSVLAVLYVLTGMSKLANSGLMWAHPDNIRAMFLSNALDKHVLGLGLPLKLIDMPDVLYAALGVATVAAETMFFLVLFSRRARLVLPLVMIAMHVGILVMMDVLFVGAMICQLAFIDFERLRRAVAERLRARHGTIRVLYDGWCPLCRRTMRVLRGLDLFDRLEPIDFRGADLDALRAATGEALRRSELEEEMAVVARGRIARGYDGYRVIASALPLTWPIAPLLRLPPFSTVGRPLYRAVARRRLSGTRCDEACWSTHQAPAGAPREPAAAKPWWIYAVASWLVVIGLMGVWALRVEAYPLSSMQMFSTYNRTGQFEYFRVYVHHADGTSARAYLDDAVGALHNTRFRSRLPDAFVPGGRARTERYFGAIGQAYNGTNPPSPAVRYEVQKWLWDFKARPHDADHGRMLERALFDVSPAPAPTSPSSGAGR